MRQTADTITTSRKRKKITPVNRNKTNYARILANFRVNRVKKLVKVNIIASNVGVKRTPACKEYLVGVKRTYWGN